MRKQLPVIADNSTSPVPAVLESTRYGADMPEELLEKYLISVADPAKLSLNDEVALVESAISRELRYWQEAKPAFLWGTLGHMFTRYVGLQGKFLAAKSNRDAKYASKWKADMAELAGRIVEAIHNGMRADQAQHAIDGQIDRKRRLVETEARVQEARGLVLTREQAEQLVIAAGKFVQKHVPPEKWADIDNELAGLLPGPAQAGDS